MSLNPSFRAPSIKVRLARLTFLFFSIICILPSCRIQNVPGYFNGYLDTSRMDAYRHPELLVQKGDRLSITFFSDNPQATAIYNQVSGASVPSSSGGSQMDAGKVSSGSSAGSQGFLGYNVDQDGNIRIHGIGVVHVEGLTRAELERLLSEKITAMGVLSNPYCRVQFEGLRVTVLGEVRSPGVIQFQTERMTVMDALGMAGDVLLSGDKGKVMLVRDQNGQRTYKQMSLEDKRVLQSPDYFLKQNDVIIVHGNELQKSQAQVFRQQYLSLILSIMSILVLVLNLFIN